MKKKAGMEKGKNALEAAGQKSAMLAQRSTARCSI
jgi:hypothetical protein